MKYLIVFLLLFSIGSEVYAHPLDISTTYFTVLEKRINSTTYFHTYEIDYLFKQNGITDVSYVEYDSYGNVIEDYLDENITILQDGKKCSLDKFNIDNNQQGYDILSKGFKVNYSYLCNNYINNFDINISLFNNFPLQTNLLTVYDGTSGVSNMKIIYYKVFTPKFVYDNIQINSIKLVTDSDGDGVNDEDEKVYNTNPESMDTDGDYYTDYEEIYGSWDPLNPELGPNQQFRNDIPSGVLEVVYNNLKSNDKLQDSGINSESPSEGLLNSGFGMKYFREGLIYMEEFLGDMSMKNFIYLFIIVVILGFIHALGPGHSKSILASYVIRNDVNFLKGFFFVIIFTITHLIDIIVIFFVVKYMFDYIDSGHFIYYVQLFSLILLILISLVLLYRSIRNINSISEDFSNSNYEKYKASIYLGFVSGLAPCTFGWSIFFLLFGLGKSILIIPILIALGMGIFLCLFFYLLVVYFAKKVILSKFQIVAKYSMILSSSILLFLGLVLLFNFLV